MTSFTTLGIPAQSVEAQLIANSEFIAVAVKIIILKRKVMVLIG